MPPISHRSDYRVFYKVRREKTQLTTSQAFYSYRRLDAIDIDCQCVGGRDDAVVLVVVVVELVRKRVDNFLLSTRNDHVNYVGDWQEKKITRRRRQNENRQAKRQKKNLIKIERKNFKRR